MKTVLIIDSDLGFVFWLGRTLNAEHYQALPAKNVPDAISLLDQFRLQIDGLVVNPCLPEIDSFIERIRLSQKNLKVIAVTGYAEMPILKCVDAWKERPAKIDKNAGLEWVDLVGEVVGDAYRSFRS